MRHRTAPVLAAALLSAAPLAAQRAPADTLPFRPGQWGVEGSVTGGDLGSGLLRFVSRSSAVALNLTGRYSSNAIEGTGGGQEQTTTNGNVTATLGLRRYRPFADAVAGYVAFGGLLSYGRSTTEGVGGRGETTSRQWGGGGFADLGATLFVTPRLGMSAVYGVAVTRNSSRATAAGAPAGAPPFRATGWGVSAGGVRFHAAVFF